MELLEKRRIWKRQWRYQSLKQPFEISIPFEIRPTVWPDIEVFPAPENAFRRETGMYEIEMTVDAGTAQQVVFSVFGEAFIWDAAMNLLVTEDGKSAFLRHQDGIIRVHLYVDDDVLVLDGSENSLRYTRTVSANRKLSMSLKNGTAGSFEGGNDGFMLNLTVYGLHAGRYSEDMNRIIQKLGKQEVIYRGKGYCIETNHLSDAVYGKPDAYVPDAYMIISAPRVTEEFEWRHTPVGDMTRILDSSDCWRGTKEHDFPEILTGIPSVDAAYHIALHVLQEACSEKYALPGEKGMWSAGAFQGEGMGFGVWRRDTMQLLLRGAALWASETSKKTLKYVMNSGKDNAVDGIPAPVVGCWDYYLATHDIETIHTLWPYIQERMQEAELCFDAKRGLMHAEFGSANDAFEDTDSGGYALSTEIYFMDAYRAAARFAEIFGAEKEAEKYGERHKILLDNIRNQYWNSKYGYYTSGPVGSIAFENGIWESCGQEAAILGRFNVADDVQCRSIMKIFEERILTEYGIPLMPYKKEKNHITHAAWPVYYTGFAQCAAIENNSMFLMKLIAQQIRNAVFNKTFYEVLDTDTGRNWRWPGQTWHAMGYISMLLYGVFGMHVTEDGIRFCTCIPKELEGIRIGNLKYCKMTLELNTCGYGRNYKMLLDGRPSKIIPWNMKGKHRVDLLCENK